MKNYWKWILGIVIVLFVFCGLGIGTHLMMANFYPNFSPTLSGGDVEVWRHPMMGMQGFQTSGCDGMGMQGFHSFGGGGMRMGGGLVPLLLLGGLAYLAYWLGKRNASKAQAAAAPVEPPVVRTCTKCGKQVQDGWNHCASCGKKL